MSESRQHAVLMNISVGQSKYGYEAWSVDLPEIQGHGVTQESAIQEVERQLKDLMRRTLVKEKEQ